jgi:hypothetical protein
MDISTDADLTGTMSKVFRRRPEPPPLTREEVSGLIVLLKGIDWKLERIMEALEIDDGREEED